MEFYAHKTRDLPRFIYRNLSDALNSASAQQRSAQIDAFCAYIAELQPSGDWYKMKWCLPGALAQKLSAEEKQQIEAALAKKRHRRNEKFIEAYPHCTDEFGFGSDFLDSVFGSQTQPLIGKDTKIFTFGSCFAQNIAHYLKGKGYDITPFVQVEDLNSPFSNAIMLTACTAPEDERRRYISYWLKALYPNEKDVSAEVTQAMAQLDDLRARIATSDFLIITSGNILDYFLSAAQDAPTLGGIVAPKFLSLSFKDDVLVRGSQTQSLKNLGATFRLGSYQETKEAVEALYRAIRSINPHAHLLITLSPIPIDSAIGVATPRKMGAIELDCISKSTLRTVLHEFTLSHPEDKNLVYFPSFEVIRWVAPNLPIPAFGQEDANARHVSQQILAGVYEYFLHKFGKDSDAPQESCDLREELAQAQAKIHRKKKKRWWRI